jgi:hypothetical protein
VCVFQKFKLEILNHACAIDFKQCHRFVKYHSCGIDFKQFGRFMRRRFPIYSPHKDQRYLNCCQHLNFNWRSKNRRRLHLVSREKITIGKCYKSRFLRTHLAQARYKWFLNCSLHSTCHSEIQNGHHQGYSLEIGDDFLYIPLIKINVI